MTKSHFANYKEERENANVIEDEYGFIVYKFENEYVYIEDLYVVPEKRKSLIASSYADKVVDIAKKEGYNRLLGSVSPQDPNATANLKVLLGYGFRLLSCKEEIIYFIKEI